MGEPSSNMLIRKLDSVAMLDDDLRAAIEALPIQVAELKAFTGRTNYDTTPPRRHVIANVGLKFRGTTPLANGESTWHFEPASPISYDLNGNLIKD